MLGLLPRDYEEFVLRVKTTREFKDRDGNYLFSEVVKKLQQIAAVKGDVFGKNRSKPEGKVKTEQKVVLKSKSHRFSEDKCTNCGETGH